MYVSYSMLSSMKCPMYYYYIYEKKIYPRLKSIPFLAGGLFHEGVHMYFNLVKKKKILKYISNEIQNLLLKVESNKDYTQQVLIAEAYTRAALKGYFKLYPRNEFKVIATEKKFTIPLASNIILGGRIDRVVKDKHNEVWGIEHKFTSMMGEKGYVVRTAIDQQVSIYYLALIKLGLKPKGIVYDITMKPYKKPLKHETMVEYEERMTSDYKTRPEFYFKREELIRTSKQTADLKEDLMKKVTRLKTMQTQKLYDKDTSVCNMYGLCEYFPLCANPKSSRNKLMFTNERS